MSAHRQQWQCDSSSPASIFSICHCFLEPFSFSLHPASNLLVFLHMVHSLSMLQKPKTLVITPTNHSSLQVLLDSQRMKWVPLTDWDTSIFTRDNLISTCLLNKQLSRCLLGSYVRHVSVAKQDLSNIMLQWHATNRSILWLLKVFNQSFSQHLWGWVISWSSNLLNRIEINESLNCTRSKMRSNFCHYHFGQSVWCK